MQLLSGEKGAKIEPEQRRSRSWSYLQKPGKFGLTTKLPETLGFYDFSAVRRRQKDYAAGNVKGPLMILITLINVKRPVLITDFCLLIYGYGVIVFTLGEQACRQTQLSTFI